MVEFSDVGHVLFNLNDFNTKSAVQQAIGAAAYDGGGTNIADGMMVAINQVFTASSGDRPSKLNSC